MNSSRIGFALVIILLMSSCFNRKVGKGEVLDPITITASSEAIKIYRASAPMVWDIAHTRIALRFNLAEKTADGNAWINLHPYLYETDTLILDAKSMSVESVVLEGKTKKTLNYTYNDDKLRIKLDKTYKTEDTIQLYIKYKAMPYKEAAGGSAAIAEDRGLFFINTDHSIKGKPVQIWTQGETESNSHWMPTFDKPNERFTTQIELTVADSFTTLSNGYLLSQVRAGKGFRTDTWIMEKAIQPYANMFAIGNYSIVKDEWRGREVSYYVEPEFEPYARLMFKNTPAMMDYFSTITGVPYPWNKYSQVVVRDYVSGAMENTTATVFGEFINQNARENADNDYEDIVSHELFHQWFGDYVTAESWSNLTVNESFANYGEQLWRRYKYGDASADELAYNDLWKYLSGAGPGEPPLVRYHYSGREDMFDRISYEKGGATLNYLHHLIGDAAFYKAMSIYLKQNALKPAEATHWRLAVEEATGQDWNWFFRQWYYRAGYPVLDVVYNYDDKAGQLTMSVTQKQDSLYILPLKAEVIYGSTKSVIDWNINNRTEQFTYAYKDGVRPVIVPDAAHWLVGKIRENKTSREWLIQFAASNDNIINKFNAFVGLNKKLEDSASQAIITLALQDKEATIRAVALNTLAPQTSKKIQDKWKADAALMAVNDRSNKVRAAAFDVLADWKISSSKQDMLAALSDSSYSVAGSALRGLKKLKDDTVYTISKQVLQTNAKRKLLFTAFDIIAEKGNMADTGLFTSRAHTYYGNNKIEFAIAMSTYLKNVREITAYEKIVPVYVQLTNTESISNYRFALGTFFFDAAKAQKGRVVDARGNVEKEQEQKKLDLMRTAADQIIKAETDKDNLNRYRKARTAIFGN